MKLMTKAIAEAAVKQFPLGSEMAAQKVVAKFFDPTGGWKWYLMNIDPEDPDYAWGIVKGFEVEVGSFSISELQGYVGKFGLGIERDTSFEPAPAAEVYEKLLAGKFV